MPTESPSVDARPPLAHLLIPLATGAALYTYGSAQVERSASVETLYLALVACAVLLPVAALAVRPALELTVTAVLVTLAAWAVPAGPARGAAIGLLLLLSLAVAFGRALGRRGQRLGWSLAIPAALGIQLLARSDELLAVTLGPRTLVSLLGLPLAAGAATAILARKRSTTLVLVAAATVAILPPGWSVTVTLSLLALATGPLATERSWPAWARWAALALVAAAAFAWQPPLAALLVLAAAADHGASSWKIAFLVSVLALGAVLIFPAARSWAEIASGLAFVPLLLPSLVDPDRGRLPSLVAGAVLAATALRIVGGPDALAPALLLIALALSPEGALARVQRLWTALLLGGAVMLAAYPWLRREPLGELLGLVSLEVDWTSALTVVAVALLVVVTHRVAGGWLGREDLPEATSLAVLGLAAWMALPAAGVKPLGERVVSLSEASPGIARELSEPVPVSRIVLDSYLADSTSLAPGTPVALVELVDGDGRRRRLSLELGVHTGEWAARRPDVAALPGFAAPPAWLAWVAPSGDVFAQRYRAVWRLETMFEARSVKVRRARDLPPGVTLALFHLELQP